MLYFKNLKAFAKLIMKILLQLFTTFFKIGLFTLGGGYAMLPIIQSEIVDKRKWIDSSEFLELLAIAQSAPGPVAVNTSVFIGYKIAGLKGIAATTLGCVMPSFIVILILAMYLADIRKYKCIEAGFKALRPAVAALILVPVITNARQFKKKISSYIIAAVSAIAVAYFSVSPIYVILIATFIGLILGFCKKQSSQEKAEVQK